MAVAVTYDIDQGQAWGTLDTFVYAVGSTPDQLRFFGNATGTLELSDTLSDLVVDPLESFLVDPHVAWSKAPPPHHITGTKPSCMDRSEPSP